MCLATMIRVATQLGRESFDGLVAADVGLDLVDDLEIDAGAEVMRTSLADPIGGIDAPARGEERHEQSRDLDHREP